MPHNFTFSGVTEQQRSRERNCISHDENSDFSHNTEQKPRYTITNQSTLYCSQPIRTHHTVHTALNQSKQTLLLSANQNRLYSSQPIRKNCTALSKSEPIRTHCTGHILIVYCASIVLCLIVLISVCLSDVNCLMVDICDVKPKCILVRFFDSLYL